VFTTAPGTLLNFTKRKEHKMVSKKQVKEAVIIASGQVHSEKTIAKQDGTYEVRKSFFYTHGGSSEKWAEKVSNTLPGVRVVTSTEYWKAWPKTSYWATLFEVIDPEALVEFVHGVCEKYNCTWKELLAETKTSMGNW